MEFHTCLACKVRCRPSLLYSRTRSNANQANRFLSTPQHFIDTGSIHGPPTLILPGTPMRAEAHRYSRYAMFPVLRFRYQRPFNFIVADIWFLFFIFFSLLVCIKSWVSPALYNFLFYPQIVFHLYSMITDAFTNSSPMAFFVFWSIQNRDR